MNPKMKNQYSFGLTAIWGNQTEVSRGGKWVPNNSHHAKKRLIIGKK
jgi:hypothetical protein